MAHLTEKQKALELIEKFDNMLYKTNWEQSKKCAIIAVDEMLDFLNNMPMQFATRNLRKTEIEYYKQVKTELLK